MKILYIIYQICIGLPIFLVLTILTALTTMIGCWLANLYCFTYPIGIDYSYSDCHHCRLFTRRSSFLGILSRKNLVSTHLLAVSSAGFRRRSRKDRPPHIVCFPGQSSGSIRYIPDLRISGKKLQMDDEKKSPQSSFCRKGMRIGRFHFCR